jgi:anaerobic selenocysteine-containing dehydrogenase/ferredoxin-NADP reductase
MNVIEDGRLIEVKPLPSHPTGKALCPKGRAAPDIVHDARRLTTPLMRTRPKKAGDPGWQPVSWAYALDFIAGILRKIAEQSGPEAVAFGFTSPSGASISDSLPWLERFVWSYGSPNICWATELCNWHKDHGHEFTFGTGLPVPDYRNSALIVLWGHNPASTWLAQAEAIGEARRNGARLAVIDPRRTALARDADLWLQIVPGMDGVLALAAVRHLIESGTYDGDFVRRWTNGPLLVRTDNGRFLRAAEIGLPGGEAFVVLDSQTQAPLLYDTAYSMPRERAQMLALEGTFDLTIGAQRVPCRPAFALYAEAARPFTAARTSALTGLPESAIDAFADEIARASSLSYYCWTGTGQHTNASQIDRAIATLFALKGQYDAPGGNVRWAGHPVPPVSDYRMLPEAQRQKAIGLDRLPLGPPSRGWITGPDLYRAIRDGVPYQVRGLFSFGSNLLVSQPDPALGREALECLEFYVHCDLRHNPTSHYADIVLPVNSAWERESLRIGFEIGPEAQELIQLRPQMIANIGEGRSDHWIVAELAKRLGFGERFYHSDFDRAWNEMLRPAGLTTELLRNSPGGVRAPLQHSFRKYAGEEDGRVAGFETPTRRVELYSERLLEHGYPPLPEPLPSKVADEVFPVTLTTAKSGHYCHSQHRGIAALRKRSPVPCVDIPAALATKRGIADGDGVEIRAPGGRRITMTARIDPALSDRVAVAEYGWWEASPDLGLPGFELLGRNDANYNSLTADTERDPVSGAPGYRSLACDIVPLGDGVAPWRGFRPLAVSAVNWQTPDVACLELSAPDGSLLPRFAPGQFLTLALDEMRRDAQAVRSYSFCGPSELLQQRYRVAVKVVSEGLVSPLIAAAQPGQVMLAQPPAGRFLLPLMNEFPIVMLAGGIGITPFISYLETLELQSVRPELYLYYAVSSGAHHAFAARIRDLARAMPELNVVTFYSRPAAGDRAGVDYDYAGRLSLDVLGRRLLQRRARFYMCGPGGMMDALSARLRVAGVPQFEIFRERFLSPRPLPGDQASPSHSVIFRRSNLRLEWTAQDGTILDLAGRNGVSVPTGCRVGQCESCALRIVEGQVAHNVPLDEINESLCLSCCAIPVSDVVIDA